jgi:hypothetical protein
MTTATRPDPPKTAMLAALWLISAAISNGAVILMNPFGPTGIQIESSFTFTLLPESLTAGPDFELRKEFGQWTIRSFGTSNIMAFGGTVCKIQSGYGTLTGANWPHTAYFRDWWDVDDKSGYLGLFSNPSGDDLDASRYHQLLRIAINPDGSLQFFDWGYETIPGIEISVNSVPESKQLIPAITASVTFLTLRRSRRMTTQRK